MLKSLLILVHKRKYYLFIARHDALFVVGSVHEALTLRGMRYHPVDIENSVIRCHKSISEW